MAGAAALGVTEVPSRVEHQPAYRPPTGWQTVTYGGAAISVPKSWTLAYLQACPNNRVGTLVVGTAPPSAPALFCPMVATTPRPRVVHLGKMARRSTPRGGHARVVNGLRLYPVRGTGGRAWTIPSLHLEVSASGPGTTAVVRTVRRA